MTVTVKKKILIADDDADIRELVGFYMESNGFEVFYAVNGPEALATAREKLPDVILLDVMMPDINGYHVCKTLCETTTGPPPKILIMTGRNTQKEAGLARLSGSVGMIQKPFKLSEVKKRIDDLFLEE